jgi:hypothetical protein
MTEIDNSEALLSTTRPASDLPTTSTASTTDDLSSGSSWTSERWALIVFAVAVGSSGMLVLTWLGSQRWFTNDEWDFLITRHLTDVGDLFRPHNEHWTTLPAVAYRLMWSVVGLDHYWPYQALVVGAHLTVVVLLRMVMRRAGVGPWIATVAAGSLLLFGSGEQDIVWAFQITFVGAFAFGLVHLLLADHDGPFDRRDWLGLAAGAAALMCSGIGITMAVLVGLAVLIRRGWRLALLHTVPLAVLYGTWWLIERPPSGSNPLNASQSYIAGVMARFVGRGITSAFEGLGYFTIVGVALAIMLVVGLVLAWRSSGWTGFRVRGAPIAALLVGLVASLLLSAYGRWPFGAEYAATSRYVYLSAALLLPALAVAADALSRRWRVLTPVVLVLLLVGVPFNIKRFIDEEQHAGPGFALTEQLVVAIANAPEADQVPEWVEIDPRPNPGLTIGWLRHLRDSGELPQAAPVDEATANQIPIRLGFVQTFGRPPSGSCSTLSGKLDLRPEKGTIYGFSGGLIAITPLDDDGQPTAPPIKFAPSHGRRLNVLLSGLHIQIKPGALGVPISLCT